MRRPHCEESGWHVFDRGIRRLQLFRDESDDVAFLRFLKFGLRKSGCLLWAYCLMMNHYHLVLYGSSAQLTMCMHHLNRLYAEYHNDKYSLSGHVFDGPYRAFRSPTYRLLLWKVAYVFLNPVKAGICGRPEDYRWSGYRSFVGLAGSPLELEPSSLMRRLDMPAARAWERFYECLRLESKRPSKIHQGVPTLSELYADQFESLLDQARKCRDLPAGLDPLEVAVYWAKQSGIAPRFMASALGSTSSREIRDLLKAFTTRMDREPQLSSQAAIP